MVLAWSRFASRHAEIIRTKSTSPTTPFSALLSFSRSFRSFRASICWRRSSRARSIACMVASVDFFGPPGRSPSTERRWTWGMAAVASAASRGSPGCSCACVTGGGQPGCLWVQGMLSTCAVSRRSSAGSREFVPSGAATGFSARISTDLAAHQETQTPGARPQNRFDSRVRARVEARLRRVQRSTDKCTRSGQNRAFLRVFLPVRADESPTSLYYEPSSTTGSSWTKSALRHDLPGGIVVERLPRGQQPRKLVAQLGAAAARRPGPRSVIETRPHPTTNAPRRPRATPGPAPNSARGVVG